MDLPIFLWDVLDNAILNKSHYTFTHFDQIMEEFIEEILLIRKDRNDWLKSISTGKEETRFKLDSAWVTDYLTDELYMEQAFGIGVSREAFDRKANCFKAKMLFCFERFHYRVLPFQELVKKERIITSK